MESYQKVKKLKYIDKLNLQCNVSKASNEIMLDRLSVINEVEFPFSNYLK